MILRKLKLSKKLFHLLRVNLSKRINDPLYSDFTLTILSNLNNPLVRVHFTDAFPISLTDVNFDTKISSETIITATAIFNYDYFTFENP
jgi:hypothetical protein